MAAILHTPWRKGIFLAWSIATVRRVCVKKTPESEIAIQIVR